MLTYKCMINSNNISAIFFQKERIWAKHWNPIIHDKFGTLSKTHVFFKTGLRMTYVSNGKILTYSLIKGTSINSHFKNNGVTVNFTICSNKMALVQNFYSHSISEIFQRKYLQNQLESFQLFLMNWWILVE